MPKFEPNEQTRAGQYIDIAARDAKDGKNGKPGIFTTAWGAKRNPPVFCKEGCTCKRHQYYGPISRWTLSSRAQEEAYEIPYTDDGCEVSLKCVECPLSECRYVDPVPFREWKNGISEVRKTKEEQVNEILDLQSEGFTSLEICEKMGINKVRDLRWKVISFGYQWEGDHPFDVKRLR